MNYHSVVSDTCMYTSCISVQRPIKIGRVIVQMYPVKTVLVCGQTLSLTHHFIYLPKVCTLTLFMCLYIATCTFLFYVGVYI
jgi:hypothetical protein